MGKYIDRFAGMTAVTINSWIYGFFFFNSVLMSNARKRSRFAKFGSKDSIARVAHYFFRIGFFQNETLWRSLIGNIRSRSYWHTATKERIAYV